MEERNETWATHQEIQFLKNLGKKLSRTGRIALLQKYRQQITARKEWGLIDPAVVRAYLMLEIGDPGKEKTDESKNRDE